LSFPVGRACLFPVVESRLARDRTGSHGVGSAVSEGSPLRVVVYLASKKKIQRSSNSDGLVVIRGAGGRGFNHTAVAFF